LGNAQLETGTGSLACPKIASSSLPPLSPLRGSSRRSIRALTRRRPPASRPPRNRRGARRSPRFAGKETPRSTGLLGQKLVAREHHLDLATGVVAHGSERQPQGLTALLHHRHRRLHGTRARLPEVHLHQRK